IGGDFNEVMELQLDRSIKAKMHPSGTNLITELNLVDIWRLLNPTVRDYFFFSRRHNSNSRIDYFLILRSLVGDTHAADIESRLISDHTPISCLETSRTWRLNASLLHILELQASIKDAIANFFKDNPKKDHETKMIWDNLKAVLRGRLISYATNSKKEIKTKGLALKQNLSLKDYHSLQNIKYKYNKLSLRNIEFALFRLRQNYFEEGRKLLAFRLRKLKASNTIRLIKNEQGDYKVQNRDINEAFKCFYSNLYTSEAVSDNSKISNYLANINLPRLDQTDRDMLDAPISDQEISKAICGIKSG
uniref:Endonuclease/exonuclease/phosphatase domain-containing protein n=1 Tax=Latimeria chalumnae TaxID=7897 RepID=H3AK97_LATCH